MEMNYYIPTLQPDDCEWVACIDPPLPHGHNLKNDFDGITPYDFYTNATYECEDGFFFEQASAVLQVKKCAKINTLPIR